MKHMAYIISRSLGESMPPANAVEQKCRACAEKMRHTMLEHVFTVKGIRTACQTLS